MVWVRGAPTAPFQVQQPKVRHPEVAGWCQVERIHLCDAKQAGVSRRIEYPCAAALSQCGGFELEEVELVECMFEQMGIDTCVLR